LLDNNNPNVTAFGKECKQVNGNQTFSCSVSPSSIKCDFRANATSTNYYDLNAGGYTTSGWLSDSLNPIFINDV